MNRVQTLRSSVAGSRPSGRSPGEIYVNFPDAQLGVVNAASTAQDLLPVRFFSTLASYPLGSFVVNANQLYRANQAVAPGAFNAAQWTMVGGSVATADAPPPIPQTGALWWDSVGGELYVYYDDGNSKQWVTASNFNGGAYLPLSGGTMSGPVANLVVTADPTSALQVASKQYVDAQNIRYRNRVINGDMSVDQRNGGATFALGASSYAIDRWRAFVSGTASKGNCGQIAPANSPVGFLYALTFGTTVAYSSPAAGDLLIFNQSIEGYNFNDAQWGTVNALPVVLEFWASAAIAGTYAVSLINGAASRSYVSTFALPAGGWTKVRLNILGDTSGTWNVAATAGSLAIRFTLCAGSTFQTSTVNAWQAGNFLSTPSTTNVLATTSGALSITGVALMVGTAAANAEPEFKKYSDNLIDCMRYFNKFNFQLGGYGAGAGGVTTNSITLAPQMRATPTAVIQSGMSYGGPATSASTSPASNSTITTSITISGAGGAWAYGLLTADADF
jgi:hypothetical protein